MNSKTIIHFKTFMKYNSSVFSRILLITILLVSLGNTFSYLVHSRIDVDEPSISSISVTQGSIEGGTQITIYGYNFNTNAAKNRVRIGNFYQCPILADGTKKDSITCSTDRAFDPQNRYSQFVKV